MGILGKIFGSGEVIKEGLSLIDSIHTSDIEEIQAKTKAKVDLIQAYAPYKIAQRYLAVIFAANYIVAFWVAVGLWFYGGDLKGFVDLINQFWVGEIVAAIIGFYFGGGFLESRNKKAP